MQSGQKNNQNFIQLPFFNLIKKIKYKLYKAGIQMKLQHEGYTL